MWVREKFFRFKLTKRLLIFLLIFTFQSQKSISSPKNDITKNFDKINNLSFEFKQQISNKIEKGKCYIEYPKLIYCLYDNKNQKEMISNGKTLVIKNNRYNKTYFYPLKTTPLDYILDKNFILNGIKNIEPTNINNEIIQFSIIKKKNLINIFFDSKTFDLAGWSTTDIYQNVVIFKIKNIKKNITIDKNKFKLPKPS